MGVRSLALFGSTARGDSGEDSDVDLLVEFDRPIGLFHLLEVKEVLETWLHCDVDLVPRDSLHPALHAHVLAQAETVLAA